MMNSQTNASGAVSNRAYRNLTYANRAYRKPYKPRLPQPDEPDKRGYKPRLPQTLQTAPTANLSQILPIRLRLPRTNQLCLHYQRLRRIRCELHRKEDNRPIQLQLMPQLLIWLI